MKYINQSIVTYLFERIFLIQDVISIVTTAIRVKHMSNPTHCFEQTKKHVLYILFCFSKYSKTFAVLRSGIKNNLKIKKIPRRDLEIMKYFKQNFQLANSLLLSSAHIALANFVAIDVVYYFSKYTSKTLLIKALARVELFKESVQTT